MKIRRQKFADVVHQKPVGEIPVNMDMQHVAVRIDETRQQRERADQPQPLQPSPDCLPLLTIAEVLDPAADEVHPQQSKAKKKSAMQIDPQQHQNGQAKKSAVFF